jgi:hypothetical protein
MMIAASLLAMTFGNPIQTRLKSSNSRGDVLTTAQARKLLDPLIKPLPPFEETVLSRRGAA